MNDHVIHHDPAVVAIVEREVRRALTEAAVACEREKHISPINGDGSNYALDRAIRRLCSIAGDDSPAEAAAAERARLDAEYLARWRKTEDRLHQIPPP